MSSMLLCRIVLLLVVVQIAYSFSNVRYNVIKKPLSNFILRESSSLISKDESIISSSSSLSSSSLSSSSSSEVIVKKTPIGSIPEFALPSDSVEETPMQRTTLYLHFIITAINLAIASSSLTFSSIYDFLNISLLVISSIILGDFATGVFHWSVDNYGSIKTPVFGAVCVAFQGHHDTPWTITFRSFANNVYKICYATIGFLSALMLLNPGPFTRIFFTLFINWWMLSQEFHKMAHMKVAPPSWKFLQDKGIILSKKEHGLHHTSPFEGHYCILTGICNRVLDNTKFFRHMERIVYKLTGNIPNTWKADSSLKDTY